MGHTGLALPNPPWVLFLGKGCMDKWFAFYWQPYTASHPVCPKGARIDVQVHDNIPYGNGMTQPYFPKSSKAVLIVVGDSPFNGHTLQSCVVEPFVAPEVSSRRGGQRNFDFIAKD